MLVDHVKHFANMIDLGETVSSKELVSRIAGGFPDQHEKASKAVSTLLVHHCFITKNETGGLFIKTCEKWEL